MDAITLGVIGCFGIGCGTYLIKNAKFPHISECGCIGMCYRALGIHNHDCFDIIVEIIEVTHVKRWKKYLVEIESGRFSYKTSHNQESDGKVGFYEKIPIHIRQCDDFIILKLFYKEMIKNNLAGSLIIYANELLQDKLPRRREYTMDVHDSSTAKIMLSFYRHGEVPDNLSPLMMQALLECPDIDTSKLENMTPIEHLRIFANVITGPLKKMNSFSTKWTEYHFVPVEISHARWDWRYWKSRDDYIAGKNHIGSYSLLGFSTIVPDDSNKVIFYMKYYDKSGVYDLVFKRVDRNRDIWTEGLVEFITKQRNLLSNQTKNIINSSNKPKISSINSIKVYKHHSTELSKPIDDIIAKMSMEMLSPTST